MDLLKRLWRDESGAVLSTELVMVSSVAVTGMLVGLAEIRDSALAEMSDMGAAIRSIDQSYSYQGANGCTSASAGSQFEDEGLELEEFDPEEDSNAA